MTARDTKWPFVELGVHGLITEVAEKQPISDLATVGIYLFRRVRQSVDPRVDMIAENDRVDGEFYTCSVKNHTIASDARFGIYEVPAPSCMAWASPPISRPISSASVHPFKGCAMKPVRLEDMVRGWFVGTFAPAAIHMGHCEVAVRSYKAGHRDGACYHRVATKITLVVSGEVRMTGRTVTAGDTIVLDPGEPTKLEALTDSLNVLVKVPDAKNNNYDFRNH